MSWRVARSLLTLRGQVIAKWPNIDTAQIGIIGDARHQAQKSDHNPDSKGIVRAIDIPNTPAIGLVSRKLAEDLLASRDTRIRYLISNRQIVYGPEAAEANGAVAWVWEAYTKDNPHEAHMHLSVSHDDALADDTRPWAIDGAVIVLPRPVKPSNQFNKCVALVLVHEGGNDDDPRDPGGRTSRGILQSEWNKWRDSHTDFLPQDVWNAPQDQVIAIYRQEYWDAMRCDELPPGVDYAVFDFGVNSGISRSAKFLQAIVGTNQDGVIGKNTLAATAKLAPISIINTLCDRRLSYLYGLSIWQTFGNGWSRRVSEVRAAAFAMAAKSPVPQTTEPPPMTTPVPTTVHIDLPAIERGLASVQLFLPMVSGFFPQVKVITPLIPIAQGLVKMVEELQAAGHDPAVIAGVIANHLHAIADQLKTVFPPPAAPAPA